MQKIKSDFNEVVRHYERDSSLTNSLDMEDEVLSMPDVFNQCFPSTMNLPFNEIVDRNVDSISKTSLNQFQVTS